MKTVISKARNIAYQLGVLFANTLTTKDVSNVYKKRNLVLISDTQQVN